jgi:hypothetical protein
MKINLAYGKTGLELELKDTWNVQVVEPRYVPGLPDPKKRCRMLCVTQLGQKPLLN